MTERIYYTDAYATEFDARIVARSADGVRVVLDRTAFYPTSGGQQFDTGTLASSRVVDVIDEDDRIWHVLSAPLNDDAVRGVVDWGRRFDHMQQHTGQHVLSAVCEDLFGFRTASVHFGAESSSVDLEAKELSAAQILQAETRANEIVFANLPVTVSFEDAATVQGLRKPPPRAGELRVITVDGVDRSACGGTHVRRTGEIGAILLRRQERMHGNARVEFLCGSRAVRRSRADYELLSRAAASLGVAPDELADRTAALATDVRDGEKERKRLVEELAAFRVRIAHAAAAPDERGVRWIVERRSAGSLDELRPMALAIMTLPHAVLLGVIENPPQILFAASEDSGLDAGKLLKAAIARAGGRGGGSARLAQGTVSADELGAVIDQLRGHGPE